jgi:hypothetical protein
MSAAARIPREPVAPETPEKNEFAESMTKLFTSGVGRLAEVQKKTLDIATQQNAEAVDFWKKTVKKMPGAPGLFLFELAGSGFERYVEIQKGLVDLMAEQSRAVAEWMKERTTVTNKVGEVAVKFAQQTVERTVATHKKNIDHAAAQTNAVFDTARKQFGLEGSPVESATDSIQRGVNAMMEAQKDLLEVATR